MLCNPPIGPVIGYSQPDFARFMAGIQQGNDQSKINCGWFRIRPTGSQSWEGPFQFRFNSNFYYTGVIEYQALTPGTDYEYQIAYDDDLSESKPDDSEWSDITVHSFTHFPTDSFQFAFGSCLRSEEDSRKGKVLKIIEKLSKEKPFKAFFWLGDQIYNDRELMFTEDNSTKKDFTRRYEEFFDNEYTKQILPSISNYMVMDDHEIED